MAEALGARANWCEVLILPFNVKQCLAPKGSETLTVKVGRKFDQPLKDAYGVDFKYLAQNARVNAAAPLRAHGRQGRRARRTAERSLGHVHPGARSARLASRAGASDWR